MSRLLFSSLWAFSKELAFVGRSLDRAIPSGPTRARFFWCQTVFSLKTVKRNVFKSFKLGLLTYMEGRVRFPFFGNIHAHTISYNTVYRWVANSDQKKSLGQIIHGFCIPHLVSCYQIEKDIIFTIRGGSVQHRMSRSTGIASLFEFKPSSYILMVESQHGILLWDLCSTYKNFLLLFLLKRAWKSLLLCA